MRFSRRSNCDTQLADLLQEAVQKNRHASTSAILFDRFRGPYVRNWGSPKLILRARKHSESRVGQALGHSPSRGWQIGVSR